MIHSQFLFNSFFYEVYNIMTEIQSFPFDFHRSPSFFERWNLDFLISNMNGTSKNFKIVIAEDCYDDIADNLTTNRTLNSSVTGKREVTCALKWEDEIISLGTDVEFTIGNSTIPLKGIFLTTSSGYVMGYCLNINAFNITNKLRFDKGTIFYSIG